jgi:hypothetical protein
MFRGFVAAVVDRELRGSQLVGRSVFIVRMMPLSKQMGTVTLGVRGQETVSIPNRLDILLAIRLLSAIVPAQTRAPSSVTPDQFIAKWKSAELKERAAAHSHFIDFMQAAGRAGPDGR